MMTEKAFVEQLEEVFINEGYLSKKELGVGYGVADLVLIKEGKMDIRRCKKRIGYKQTSPLLKDEYFKILKYIPDLEDANEPASLDYLIEKTKLSKALLKYQLLKNLERHHYIKRVDNNFFFKVNGWLPIAKEIIAIEAKMLDWKRGFIQANRYRSFADRVYLAVPASKIHLVDIKLLKNHNVGLISFDALANKKRIVQASPKIDPVNEYKRSQAIEFFWNKKVLGKLALL